jgi:uncharacterized Tic20 family protein
MSNEISLKFRCLAALFHILGGSISASVVAYITVALSYTYIPISTRNIAINTAVAMIPATILLSPIVILILWEITKQRHSFVNQCGRDAINCWLSTLLSMMICTIFTIFIFSVTCGVGSQDVVPFFLSIIPFCLVTITYFLNSVIAVILATQGYRFNSRLIYPFVRPL